MQILTLLGSFFSGVIGSMGFGSGTVLIILMTVFLSIEQKTAQGVNLVFFIPCAVYSIIFYLKKRLIKKDAVLPLVIPGLFGAAAGYLILSFISPLLLRKMFGALLILIALKQLLMPLFRRFSGSGAEIP